MHAPRLLWLLLVSVTLAQGHDSPEHLVESLTARMAREGKSSRLLFQRATEYRALQNLDAASQDLREALRISPSFLLARIELSRVYLAQNRIDDALHGIQPAIDQAHDAADRAPLLMLRAQVHLARQELEQALIDAAQAIQLQPGKLDWYLIQGQIQRQLGRAAEAVRGLRQGYEQTGSFVLEVAWIEALIDAGRERAALKQIAPHLQASRWRSGWLLRRGRARLGLGEKSAAEEDLRAAILEINQRLDPDRPDLTLLAERGLAHALLGHRREAEADLKTAKKQGAPHWLSDRLEKTLAD